MFGNRRGKNLVRYPSKTGMKMWKVERILWDTGFWATEYLKLQYFKTVKNDQIQQRTEYLKTMSKRSMQSAYYNRPP